MTNPIPLADLVAAVDLLSTHDRNILLDHLNGQASRSGTAQRGAKMAAALEQLAKAGSNSISDPSAWQREQRAHRDLPGRE
jgi:hypothetical protein